MNRSPLETPPPPRYRLETWEKNTGHYDSNRTDRYRPAIARSEEDDPKRAAYIAQIDRRKR